MTIKELILKLETYDPDLPVALADWQEQYVEPSIRMVKHMHVREIGDDTEWDGLNSLPWCHALVLGEGPRD